MNSVIICDTYLALEMPACSMEKADWEALVRHILSESGRCWPEMCMEVFACHESVLLIARPQGITGIKIAPYARSFLQEYFTE